MKTDIRTCSLSDAKLLAEYYTNNALHLAQWEPLREQGYHSEDAWRVRLSEQEKQQNAGTAKHFIMADVASQKVIALCSLTNIVRGPFMACNMGYSVAERYQGKGLMKALCEHALHFAFSELQLNRVMANYMPCNHRSEALLNSLGFVKEGVASKYLKINGQWEDHILTALLNPIHK